MPKTQTPKVTYLIASWILCAQFVLPPSAYSEPLPEEQSKSHKHCRTDLIFYGRGILTSSKCYFFQSLGEDSIPKELQKVKEGDPSFTATARWVRNHILAILNRPNHATEQVSSCALHLYTYDSQGELALLMTVPLGPKQLGPDYLKDINELRSTMNSQNLLNKEK